MSGGEPGQGQREAVPLATVPLNRPGESGEFLI
jgi:hypothetical protein